MPHRKSRNVSLTSELEGYIDNCLASGDYANASEVVRAALCRLRDGQSPGPLPIEGWPKGGGECGELIRSKEWAKSPVGSIDSWGAELRTTVANIVNSPVAKVLMWGESRTPDLWKRIGFLQSQPWRRYKGPLE